MPHEINIKPVLNGFVCRVGCQTVVVKSIPELGAEIMRYYREPQKVEDEYRKDAVNKVPELAPQPVNRRVIRRHKNRCSAAHYAD